MGYEHTVEGMSLKMTTKEIEGNEICGLFAHVAPTIKRMNLNINITKIVEKELLQ